jgi:hypothetical protein
MTSAALQNSGAESRYGNGRRDFLRVEEPQRRSSIPPSQDLVTLDALDRRKHRSEVVGFAWLFES